MNSSSKLKLSPLLMKIDFCKCLHCRGPRGLDEKMYDSQSWWKQFYGSLDKSLQQEMWYLFFDSSNFYFTRHFRALLHAPAARSGSEGDVIDIMYRF